MQGYFPAYVDRSLRLTSYWADCEVQLADDVKAARAVWEEALKTPAGRSALSDSLQSAEHHCTATLARCSIYCFALLCVMMYLHCPMMGSCITLAHHCHPHLPRE